MAFLLYDFVSYNLRCWVGGVKFLVCLGFSSISSKALNIFSVRVSDHDLETNLWNICPCLSGDFFFSFFFLSGSCDSSVLDEITERLVGWVLWYINLCRLLNAKSTLYIYIKYTWFGLVGFYGISTLVGYLMSNSLNTYIIIIIMLRYQHRYSWPSLTTPPYRPLHSTDPQGYIQYQHRAAICRFEMDVLLCLSIGRGSQEYITYELVPTSLAASRMSGSSNFESFHDGW